MFTTPLLFTNNTICQFLYVTYNVFSKDLTKSEEICLVWGLSSKFTVCILIYLATGTYIACAILTNMR